MLSIMTPTTVECIGDGKLVSKKNGGYLFAAFCKDLAGGERKTYIRLVTYDDELAQYLHENTANGSKIAIEEAKLKSNRPEPKKGLRKKQRVTYYEIVVTKATVVTS
jgi:hypothetical protein